MLTERLTKRLREHDFEYVRESKKTRLYKRGQDYAYITKNGVVALTVVRAELRRAGETDEQIDQFIREACA